MKLERTKNTKRNIRIGIIYKIVSLLLPFFVQTVFIHVLGAEFVGLRGVFSSVLQVLSLAELGFGSAIIFNMYTAVANDDKKLMCALLNLYRRVYRYIGMIILAISVIPVPFIPIIVKGHYPAGINIYYVYFLYVLNTAVSYFLFAYKHSVLEAFQRKDVIGKINIAIQVFLSCAQISCLVVFKSFYLYLIMQIISTVATNLVVSIVVDRKFPDYRCKGEVSRELLLGSKKRIAGLFLYQLCGVTRNTFDSIFVSAYMGLYLAGMYSNYYFVLMKVVEILSIITSSMLAGVGNSLVTESKDKNYSDFKKIDFIYMLLAGWSAICMVSLYQPFMILWAGENMLFSSSVAILFSLYFYVLCMGNIRAVYSDAAGLWWENRYRTVIEAVVNILLNYIFVSFWGVYGVIIATILTVFVFGWVGSAYILFKHLFGTGLKKYVLSHFVYLLVTLVAGAFSMIGGFFVSGNNWLALCIRAIICVFITPIVYFAFYRKTKIYNESKEWIIPRIRG